jgi:allantoinase
VTAHELAIVGGDVVLGGDIARVNLGVRDGIISLIADGPIDAEQTLDATGLTVMPGVIDEHFHVFWGYGWETYENATRAAAKGGVTTVVDMPLDRPPTLTAAALRAKLDAVQGNCHVDYACFGGYLEEDPDEMGAMAAEGVAAFKLFTGGVAPPGMYPGVDDGQALDALRRAAAAGRTTTIHCENAGVVDFETRRLMAEGRTDPAAWDEARPWYGELLAAQSIATIAHVAGARAVIAHVSSPQTAEAISHARRGGADVWVETCHHYLCTSKEVAGSDLRQKWNPPTRDRRSVDALWRLLADGHVHTVASDHAPLPKGAATDIWDQVPGSGNGVEIFFPLFATQAVHEHGIPLTRVADLVSTTPARLFGLHPRKGAIAVGSDADLAIVETSGRRILDARELEYHEQERWSPFDGSELRVYPVYTVLRGTVIFAEGEVTGRAGDGRHLTVGAGAPV